MCDPRLAEHRLIWGEKPVLRKIYSDFYARMAAACRPGRTLEIGGGSGNFKQFAADVISCDILSAPWLDARADGHALPFAENSFDNVVMMDVLHHAERPGDFLDEISRVLKPGGRIVLMEPLITPVSWFFYRFFHPEDVDMGADPLAAAPPMSGRDPFEANQAIPTLLFFGRHKPRFAARFPSLKVVELKRFSLFAYPLSGGFRPWSLIPAAFVGPLLRLEGWLMPVFGPLMAFRCFTVLTHS